MSKYIKCVHSNQVFLINHLSWILRNLFTKAFLKSEKEYDFFLPGIIIIMLLPVKRRIFSGTCTAGDAV